MKASGTWVLAAAIVGSGMSFIDGTAVNVALPALQRDLHANSAQLQWVIEGYALFLSALILIGGSLGDRFGRRATFIAGIALFALASLACALAPNADVLVAARCVQGIGGAFATPGSLALISANFAGEERGRAIGVWSGAASITAAGGPILGGWLVQTFSWRDVFLINLPLAIVVIAISVAAVPESRDDRAPHRLDITGVSLATIGLGALVYGLILLQGGRPTFAGIGAVVAGCAALAAFVVAEGRERTPMMSLDLFRAPAFGGANLYTFFLYAAIGGSLYFLPFMLQNVQRYSPLAAGSSLLPFVLVMSVFSRWSGGLVARVGGRTPLVIGALAAALGFTLFALPGVGGSYWTTYFPAALSLGIAGAFFVAPLTTTVMDAVDARHAGLASGINNAISRTAGLIAVAALGIVLTMTFDHGLDRRMPGARLSTATRTVVARERSKLAAAAVPADVPAADRATLEELVRRSYVDGFRAVMIGSALLCVVAAFVALRTIAPKAAPA